MPSIESRLTGEAVQAKVTPASAADLKAATRRNGWHFDWRGEARLPGHSIYKITTLSEPGTIQGLLSLEIMEDHVYMHLVENAPFNQKSEKKYRWVMESLVAHACLVSVGAQHEGNVAFTAKTDLIAHYKKQLDAVDIGRARMIINEEAALKLIRKYGN